MAQRAPRRDLTGKRQRHRKGPSDRRWKAILVFSLRKKAPTATGASLRFLFYGYVSMLTLWMVMASVGFWFSSTAV